MTALSDLKIKEDLERNEIFIHPYDPQNLGSASYDVRLGRYFFEAGRPTHFGHEFYNIYSEADQTKVWGNYKTAQPAHVYKHRYQHADWSNIHDDDEIILLWPRSNLLCHTIEFIGARTTSTTMMKARSSIGRSLVNVCQCAGMGDIGYANRWTMEVYNRDEWVIPLVVGRRIAQIVFLNTGLSEKVYVSKYQETADVTVLESLWHPNNMKAALSRDRDINQVYKDPIYISVSTTITD